MFFYSVLLLHIFLQIKEESLYDDAMDAFLEDDDDFDLSAMAVNK